LKADVLTDCGKRALFGPKFSKCIAQGLKRLRKRSRFRTEFARNTPQGLKPAIILRVYGTSKLVP